MKKICYVLTISETVRAFFIPQLKYLAENGFDVTVVCSFDENLKNELGNRVKYHPIDIPRGLSVFGSISAIRQLYKFFKKEKFDMVQYSTPNAAFYSSIAAKFANVKIRNYHLMGFKYLGSNGFSRKILKLIEKIACDNSTSIECVSYSNLKLGLEEKIFPNEKATVVWNGSTGGVDLSKFNYGKRELWRNEIRKELGYSKDDFVFGFVGRITKDKGINELFKAFFDINDNSKLFLIGNIEGKETLDANLFDKAQNSNNIKFHDRVNDIERYFAAIDVLLLPSYREGFGNVIIEAAAMGTPAIVSNIPGPIDAINDGETAFTVPVKDSVALKDAMIKIKKCDYNQMGKNAYTFAKNNFDSKVLCEKILERKIWVLKNIDEQR